MRHRLALGAQRHDDGLSDKMLPDVPPQHYDVGALGGGLLPRAFRDTNRYRHARRADHALQVRCVSGAGVENVGEEGESFRSRHLGPVCELKQVGRRLAIRARTALVAPVGAGLSVPQLTQDGSESLATCRRAPTDCTSTAAARDSASAPRALTAP
jgi:hypothetical protein